MWVSSGRCMEPGKSSAIIRPSGAAAITNTDQGYADETDRRPRRGQLTLGLRLRAEVRRAKRVAADRLSGIRCPLFRSFGRAQG